jgi:hypothetical protein
MTKIHIKEFTGYDKKDWLQFLRLQRTMAFDVCFPKHTVEHLDDRDAIFIEYFIASCIGQDLSSVAEDFMYTVPAVDEAGEFNFIVITRNFKKLAAVLSLISNGFNIWNDPTPQFFDYALSFPDRLADDEPIECSLLMHICEQFSDGSDKE